METTTSYILSMHSTVYRVCRQVKAPAPLFDGSAQLAPSPSEAMCREHTTARSRYGTWIVTCPKKFHTWH